MNCGCNDNNNITNNCKPKCQPTSCACAVRLNSDCITVVGATTTCSGIDDGLILTDFLSEIDAFICTKFDELSGFISLINVGTGAEVYKGINGIGQKEIRKINASGGIVTVTQNASDITVSLDTAALDAFIEANQLTYSADNVGMGAEVFKDTTVVGDNTQFNFRTFKSSTLTITEVGDEIEIESPSTSSIPALYVNQDYAPTYNEWLVENTIQNGGTPIAGFEFIGKGSLAQPFTDTRVYPLLGGLPTITPQTSIQNALDGDLIYSYVGAGTKLLPDKASQPIIVQEGLTNYIFSGDFNYTALNIRIEENVTSTTLGYLIDMDDNTSFDPLNSQIFVEVKENKTLQITGLGFNNSGSNVITNNDASRRTCFLRGNGDINALLYALPDRHIINVDLAETGNNNDGSLHFEVRCNLVATYQGIYNVKGNGRVDFYNKLTSGNIFNSVNVGLRAFHQSGGTVRLFEGCQVAFEGGNVTPRTDVFTFDPSALYTPIFVSDNNTISGKGSNLYNKLNTFNVFFSATNLSGAGNLTITDVFESPNLWSVGFRNNILQTGIIDTTKADLTQANNVSSVNTIGNNVLEHLVIYNDRAAALLAGLPLYSAYIKTSGVAYPATAGWVRDIVLPA